MPRTANTEQATAWNGLEGVHWAEHHDHGRSVNGALHRHLIATSAIGDADHVLDIGCGTGETTRLAAGEAPCGHAVGIDLSAPMLAQARAAAEGEGIPNVQFVAGDAQVYSLPEGRFDVAISQFGIMFFADPVAAFGNIHRALRSGGRLVFVCPREMNRNDWYMVPMSALLGQPPHPQAPHTPGMFSLADRARIDAILTSAGFQDVTPQPIDVPLVFGPDLAGAVEFYLGSGPVRAFLEDHPDVTPQQARDTLTSALRPYDDTGGVRLRGAHWLVTATRPRTR